VREDCHIDFLVKEITFDENGFGLFGALGWEGPELFESALNLPNFPWRQFHLFWLTIQPFSI
jgi:hypothetical protein